MIDLKQEEKTYGETVRGIGEHNIDFQYHRVVPRLLTELRELRNGCLSALDNMEHEQQRCAGGSTYANGVADGLGVAMIQMRVLCDRMVCAVETKQEADHAKAD